MSLFWNTISLLLAYRVAQNLCKKSHCKAKNPYCVLEFKVSNTKPPNASKSEPIKPYGQYFSVKV